MTSAAASVTSIKASIKTIRTYLNNVDTWYSTYTSAHSEKYCKNLGTSLDWHDDIKRAKADLEKVVSEVTPYLDDIAWIDTMGDHKGKWSQAERECAQADLDVANKKLSAQESWKGSAGNAYRRAVTAQQGAIVTAERAAGVMSKGCSNAAYAGRGYFADLDSAFKTCVEGLPTKDGFPPFDGVMEPNPDYDPTADNNNDGSPANDTPLNRLKENSCDSHATKSGKSAASTCTTSVEQALTTFKKSFTDAFKTYPQYAYPHGGSRPNLSVSDVVGTWPKAPGQS